MLIHNADITGSLLVNGTGYNTGSFSGSFTGIVAGTTATASYVEYNNVANKPALVSGSSQITYSGLTGIPSGIVSGSAQVVYSGLTGIPSGIVSSSAQVAGFGIFATTGSNQFNGNQAITGSLTTTGTIVAQTLNVQQVTSSIVYSSGSNIFGNSVSNTQQFTGSLQVSGSSHYLLGSVGVGTTSPLSRFHVNTGTNQNFRVRPGTDVGATNGVALNSRTDDDGSLQQLTLRASDVVMLTSGNVGIGTASPESLSNNTTLQIDGTNHSFVRTGTSNYGGYFATIPTADVLCIANVRNPVTGTYSNTGKAASGINLFSESSNGYITFLTTPTNNSGPSERMRITSGGNVGIGITPSYKLDIANSVAAPSSLEPITLRLFNGSDGGSAIYFQNVVGGQSKISFGVESAGSGTDDTYLGFSTGANTALSERMRITSGGNVGIGTISPVGKLDVALLNTRRFIVTYDDSIITIKGASDTGAGENLRIIGDNLIFNTNSVGSGTERMRINSGGAIVMGNTTNYSDTRLSTVSAGTTSATYSFIAKNSTPSDLFIVRSDGLIGFPKINDFTTGNSPNTWINPSSSYGIYINTSSIRYKRDIINYDKGLTVVNQLRPVYYKGKSEVDGDKQFAGFIAEEIDELGLTEFVNYLEDGRPNSLSYPNMVVLLTKAIQELKSELDTAKAEIQLLKQQ